ncbi:type IV pili methyl-accepting chemotaxis transducer N-terminal domain-containing protein [Herminiimonas fonticola]|uniref:PilJ/NarX-like methyl-accepting chemotaxis transducer n=1 Tax=Herminiimonas fonticola TaxID=303380 RepID=A0A4R6GGN9_9BURK|nr:type IV pili methyl-accepting chemotaxis transducer N-terminal domain-containing protein [Herminiimonas fonticola]RBA24957.1 Type IV pili methyl-accepting chemotaxis transducer N-term [Herminiimonas fonticola]TDN94072.1 PilJ/NarX-like methyl-accepting chemotaxis transducer [Herminiimonas fonticola]
MNRRHFLQASLATSASLLVFPTAYADGPITHINDAINKSGRQRMLSQRLAKSYLQIGQSIDLMRSKKVFSASVALFERQLVELEVYAPTSENKVTLADLRKAWATYKTMLVSNTPNRQDAKAIMVVNEQVLALAHASTVQLEKSSGSVAARLVNISGRQRMLSQRMAKFYQAINWGVASSDALINLAKARDEFLLAMTELYSSPKNTPAINAEIMLAQQQWFFFDQALKSSADSVETKVRFATNVATTSERILETMDRITGMYEQLA